MARGDKMLTENLKKYRKKMGYTQREIAEQLYISQQAYAKYEIGTSSPNPETLAKIANILQCSMEELTDNKNVVKQISDVDFEIQKNDLSEQEKTLLEYFRSTTEQGKQRIIQNVLNICDEIEKKDTARNTKDFELALKILLHIT